MKRSRTQVLAMEKRTPNVAVIHDNLPEIQNGRAPVGIVYQKGGWTLHMLRGVIGTEKFWAGIREYYRRYRDSNASSDDLRRVMEEASGADLTWFFQQWLRRAGSPALEGGWKYNPETKKVEIELAQTQSGDAFRLPMEVAVAGRIERIEMTEKTQRFAIAAEKEPAAVDLDPNVWVLMDAKVAKR
jgi:aminopeptidase N